MSDLVERLREWSVFGYGYEASCDMKEAATAIEAQQANMANAARLLSEQTAESERLRAALRVSERDATRIALEAEKVCLQNIQMKFALGYPMPADLERHVLPENPFKCGVCAARAALEEK